MSKATNWSPDDEFVARFAADPLPVLVSTGSAAQVYSSFRGNRWRAGETMRQRLKLLILACVVLAFPLTLGACKVVVGKDCLWVAYDWPYLTHSGFYGPGCR
jgi:hypothetical protein